ncbi:MAG: hypothetical protein HYR90_01070 [Candidatus Andersenbacteria bacterium]|nr:hypothetical protein [Candidatus Andersenbacteria bacterium]MBI3251159.1 hypothetical protein [Candidatus Andersenbacteria bacterium]
MATPRLLAKFALSKDKQYLLVQARSGKRVISRILAFSREEKECKRRQSVNGRT